MSNAANNTYRFKTDGFHGELFLPTQDKYPKKALICFSGSDGGMELARVLAGGRRRKGTKKHDYRRISNCTTVGHP